MKVLATLATFVLLSTACGTDSKKSSPSPAPVTGTTTDTTTGDATAGKTTYTAECKACHGTDAKTGSAKVNITAASEADFKTAVLEGTGSMEKVDGMTATDVKNLFAYVATLKK